MWLIFMTITFLDINVIIILNVIFTMSHEYIETGLDSEF